MVERNPTRIQLVEKLEKLVEATSRLACAATDPGRRAEHHSLHPQ